jgi:hypothetical protein
MSSKLRHPYDLETTLPSSNWNSAVNLYLPQASVFHFASHFVSINCWMMQKTMGCKTLFHGRHAAPCSKFTIKKSLNERSCPTISDTVATSHSCDS